MRFAASALAFLLWAVPAAAQIDFPDKLRSTRMDGALVDAAAIDEWDGISGFSSGLCLQGSGTDEVVFAACATGGGGGNPVTAVANTLSGNSLTTTLTLTDLSTVSSTSLSLPHIISVEGSVFNNALTITLGRAAGAGNLTSQPVTLPSGGGSSTFVGLSDTPSSITADECVMGNSAGDALEFGACATGGGSFDLWDDVSRSGTLLGGTDRFLFGDDSATGDPNTYITFANLANQVRPDWRDEGVQLTASPQFINCLGGGIACSLSGNEVRITVAAGNVGDITGVTTATNSGLAGGATSGTPSLSVDVSNLPSFAGTTLHRSDQIIVRDDSDTTEKRMSLDTLFGGVAGGNLTWDQSNAELDVTGVGDITGVTAGTGLSGGGTSGTVTLTVATAYRLPASPSMNDIAQWNGSAWAAVALPSGTATPLSDATPTAVILAAGSAGSSNAAARSSHTHQLDSGVIARLLPTASSVGEVPRWNGTTWGLTTIPSASSSTPFSVGTSGASAGTNSNFSRSDHDHQLASSVTARLLPTGPSDDQIARYDSGTSSWVAEDLPAAGGGLTAQDALNLIATWARATSPTGQAPPARLGTGTADDTTFLRGDGTWQMVATGGGGTAVETLFDNTDSGDTALTQAAGALDWGRRVDIDLGRALVAADDDKWLRGYFEFTQNAYTQYLDFEIRAGNFRGWTAHTATSGNTGSPQGYEVAAARRARSGDTQASMTARLTMIYRRTASGNDVISMQIAPDGSSSIQAITDMRGVVELVPAAGGGGGAADGVVTAGVYDSANTEIDFTVADPGTDFSVDVSALATASSGDITAVNTPAESGLAGGATSGAVSLSLNVQGLLSLGLSGLASNDDVIVADGGTEYQVTLGNLSAYALSRIDNLSDLGTPAVLDKLAVIDASDSGNPKDLRLNVLSNWLGERLAGDNLTWDSSNGEIDAAAPGTGTGDITAVTTASGSGLAGGADSGAVALTLNLAGLNERTATQPVVGSDSIAFVNDSETNDPTRRVTLANFFGAVAGDNLTWDSTNNELDATGGAADGVINSLTGSYSAGTVTFTAGTSTGGSVSGSVAVPALGGDITAVTTAATSGLSGGADEGSVALTFDPDGVPTVTSVATDDRLVIVDESVTGDPPRTVTPQNFFESFDGDNLSWDSTDGELDANVAAWARNTGGTGQAPVARLGTGTTNAETTLFGDGVWRVHPTLRIFLGNPTTYDDTEARITTTALGSVSELRFADGVLIAIPTTLDAGSSTDDLELQVNYGTGTLNQRYPLVNSDGTNVTRAQLEGQRIVEAFRLNLAGVGTVWELLVPTDLTTTQVQSTTDTHYGLVSGQRVAQAVAPWARFSPSGITADDCLKGNATGTAVIFGSCGSGGGGGDITAVTAGAGLGGGGATGAVTLTLSIATLTGNRTVIANTDTFAVMNDGVAGDPTQPITWAEIVDELADEGYGLGNGTAGELNLDFSELDTETSIAQSDFLTMLDTSDTTDPAHRITLQNFITATAGTGIIRDGGDFELALSELSVDNTYAAGDQLAFRDISDTDDDSLITMQNFCNRLAAADSNMSCNTNAQLMYSASAFGGIAIEDDGSALGSGVQTLDLQGNVTVAVSGTQADLAFPFVDDRASLAASDISANDMFLVHSATHDGDRKVLLSAVRTFINSGVGDITGVTAGAGLSGGGTSGTVTLAFDIDSLPEVTTLAGADTIPIEDETDSSQGHMSIDTLAEHFAGGSNFGLDSNDLGRMILDVDDLTAVTALASGDFLALVDIAGPDPMETDDDGHTRKITVANFVNDTAGTGLDRDGENYRLDIDELTTQTSLQGSDEFAFADDSQTDNRSSNATLATIASHLAAGSTHLGSNTTGQLTTSNIGDILGVTTTAGSSGLSGGCTSGTCSLAVAPFQLTQLTALDSADWIIVGDNSDSQTPKRIAVSLLGNGNGGIDVGTNGLVIDIPEVANFSSMNDSLRNADSLLFYDASASALREITWNQFMADTFRGQGGLGLLVANSQPRLQLNWENVSSDTPVIADYLGFHDVSETDDHFKRITLEDFLDMLAASTSIRRDGAGLEVQDNGVTPAKLSHGSNTGEVLIMGTGGPEWAFPFETPRVRLARAISTDVDTLVMTGSIQAANTDTISISATVTMTQVGTGRCQIAFWGFRLSSGTAPQNITTSAGTETVTWTATITPSGQREHGSGYPVTMVLDENGIGSGESCEIAAGGATMTLSTS